MSEKNIIHVAEVKDFSRERLKEIVKRDIADFNSLTKGDLLSLFKFFCACATERKADIFVTECPLILANRENIKKNTGIQVMTLEEAVRVG